MCKFIFNRHPPQAFFVQINKEVLGGKLTINTTFSTSDSMQVLYNFINISQLANEAGIKWCLSTWSRDVKKNAALPFHLDF